ncbi:RloB family protein [Neolewinella lacunae]|uniref:RloB domain-containing protein n=1 Tax=Neolewinella lacunae TaxID=1517758 RepID=A0A923PN88_9BACT|nr:RloB family protein [Neolewinella lacunae]MBC6996569.1 RloB domain-containing protein [Neolewinella lacunae]MDN3634867.1 RloB family protein [Neolewinella lacunae]
MKARSRVAVVVRSKRTFLILCEGQTEADYFLAFSNDRVAVTAHDLGCAGKSLVDCALHYRESGSFDEVWCVYDLDYNASEGGDQFQRFQESLDHAAAHGIFVAYSMDAFELWFRLHYEAVTGALHRAQLYADLGQRWNMNYVTEGKHRSFTRLVKARLDDDPAADVALAIERARRLYEARKDLPLRERNPVTTVYLLVERLLGGWEG